MYVCIQCTLIKFIHHLSHVSSSSCGMSSSYKLVTLILCVFIWWSYKLNWVCLQSMAWRLFLEFVQLNSGYATEENDCAPTPTQCTHQRINCQTLRSFSSIYIRMLIASASLVQVTTVLWVQNFSGYITPRSQCFIVLSPFLSKAGYILSILSSLEKVKWTWHFWKLIQQSLIINILISCESLY